MKTLRPIFLLVAMALPGLVHATQTTVVADPAVKEAAQWQEALTGLSASPTQREQALVALRALASGAVDHPVTREATYALAGYWMQREDRDGLRPSIRALSAAASLYPNDERVALLLPTLAQRHLKNRDPFGAHLAFTQMLRPVPINDDGFRSFDPRLLALAAHSAARAGDFSLSLDWALSTPGEELPRKDRERLELARLRSGERLNRFDVAIDAAAWLQANGGETFRTDDRALLASARTHEVTGLFEEAVADYNLFANLFPDITEHEDVLLACARLLLRMGQPARARIYLEWLSQGERLTHMAELELLEIDGNPATLNELGRYIEVLRNAPDTTAMQQVAERMIQRYIAAGHPLELFTALASVAHESTEGEELADMVPMVAHGAAKRSLESVIRLLAARKNELAVAAVSVEAESLAILIPLDVRPVVAAARRSYGLAPLQIGPLDAAIAQAREAMTRQDWAGAITVLRNEFENDSKASQESLIEGQQLIAEALWRDNQVDEALLTLDEAMQTIETATLLRPLQVLHGDVLFSSGAADQACAAYQQANNTATSEWVTSQLERCGEGKS